MKTVYAMAHPGALPGSYLYKGESILNMTDKLLGEVKTYADHGITGVIIQNINDLPLKQDAYVEKVAYMTHFSEAIKSSFPLLKLGIMLNWNACSALAVADAVGADFVRIEHTFVGAEVYCTGLFNAQSADVMELKKKVQSTVPVFADIYDPYGSPIGKKSFSEACFDAVKLCFADGLFLEGKEYHQSIDIVKEVRQTVDVPIYLGGGSTADNVRELYPYFDALCVGKWIKKDGYILNPIAPQRLDRYMSQVMRAEDDRLKHCDL